MVEILAEGDNFIVTLVAASPVDAAPKARIVAKVRRRRDLDTASGAADAERMAAVIAAQARRGRTLWFDLREAPVSFGPRTEEALSRMLRTCEAVGMRVAAIACDGLQLLQIRRLLASTSPRHGRAFDSPAAAETYLSR